MMSGMSGTSRPDVRDVRGPLENLHSTSGHSVLCPVSGIRHPVSGLRYPDCSLHLDKSAGPRCPVTDVRWAESDVRSSTSFSFSAGLGGLGSPKSRNWRKFGQHSWAFLYVSRMSGPELRVRWPVSGLFAAPGQNRRTQMSGTDVRCEERSSS